VIGDCESEMDAVEGESVQRGLRSFCVARRQTMARC
jgi:hypothetical protein